MVIVAMIAMREESHQEDLVESDQVHDDHDDHCCIGFWRLTGQVFPFPLYNLSVLGCSSFFTVLLPPP